MIEWLNNLDIKLLIGLISSLTSILIFIAGWFVKMAYERTSLKYKLLKEFEFEQKRRLKEEIAKNKIPLLNIVEDLNHRLWNFKENIQKGWHQSSKEEWRTKEKYYLKSFVYRFLVLIHWILRVERDTMTVDSTIADNKDLVFLKYIKAIKKVFCSAKLLEELGYKNDGHNTNHFFKDDLIGFSKIVLKGEAVMDFDEFKEETKDDYDRLRSVIVYFSKIQDTGDDKNLNVLMCFHLMLIFFLDEFGYNYQRTEEDKLDSLLKFYSSKIQIKNGFVDFLKKNKLTSEMNKVVSELSK